MTKILLVLLVPFGIAGCASREPVRGWAPEAQTQVASHEIGQRYTDFKFVDSQGKERSLRPELGDFTVLAFSRCESDTHGPVVDSLQAMLKAVATDDNVRVVGIDIHWSPTGCKDHDTCHLVDAAPNRGTICDATGSIHRLYGAHKEDWFYVIGPDRTIELSMPASRAAELSKQLKAKVDKRSRENIEAAFRFERKV